MVPQKVIRVNTLLVRYKDENSRRPFLFLTTISSNIYYNANSIYNVELSMFVSGQHFNHNISIICRNCVRTSGSCVGHLNMELPFLYVNILLHSSHLTSLAIHKLHTSHLVEAFLLNHAMTDIFVSNTCCFTFQCYLLIQSLELFQRAMRLC